MTELWCRFYWSQDSFVKHCPHAKPHRARTMRLDSMGTPVHHPFIKPKDLDSGHEKTFTLL